MRTGIVQRLLVAVALFGLASPALALDTIKLEKCGNWVSVTPPPGYRCQNTKIDVAWAWTGENPQTFPQTREQAIGGFLNTFQCPAENNNNGGIGQIGVCIPTGYEVITEWGYLYQDGQQMRHFATVRFYFWSSV